MRCFSQLVKIILPTLEANNANRIIKQRMKDMAKKKIALDFMNYGEKLPYKKILQYEKKINQTRKILEDKLKTTLISISLIMTMGTAIFSIMERFFDKLNIYIILSLLFMVIALIYSVIAMVQAFNMLYDQNRVYQLSPEDEVLLSSQELKKELCLCIELNSSNNMIRNNKMNVCSRCIINSVFLFVVAISLMLFALIINQF